MNYSKHQILAFTGHGDKYVKALAAIGEDFVTEDSHAMVTTDEEIYEMYCGDVDDMPADDALMED